MKAYYLVIPALLLTSCISAADHARRLHSSDERELTTGIVQKEIHRGMSQADVAVALGSPNIVTKDSTGKETWVYDKIATEASYSRDQGGVGGLGGVGGPVGAVLILALGGADYSREQGASALTQKTLTVVIKYDQNGNVDTATYHSTRF